MKKSCRNRIVGAALLAGIFFLAGGMPASAGQYVLADRQTVTNPELDAMRGGYVTDSGFQFSLGITKAVLVDGVLQTLSSLNIPDIKDVNKIKTSVTQWLVQQGAVHQNSGSGTNSDSTYLQNIGNATIGTINTGPTFVQNTGNGTVIQNSANQKVIQNTTVMNVTTNSASMFRQMNITSNFRQQFINMLH
jgi:hypothetical protein